MNVRELFRWIIPNGLMEDHRRRFRLGRYGLPTNQETAAAVERCRYELWPAFLRSSAKPWVLVDVGANDGEFSNAASRLVGLREVHAFEPLPACHEALERSIRSVKQHYLYRVAVGASVGELELNCTGDNQMSSALMPRDEIAQAYQAGNFTVQEKIKVPVVTLDEALPMIEEIGLLKVDVQGFEMEVFHGAEMTLRRSRAVLLEVNYVQHYEGGATFDVVFECLRAHGFRVYGISAPYGGSIVGPLWADALFVKADQGT